MKKWLIIIAVVVILSVPSLFSIMGDLWWFESLNFSSVFLTILSTNIIMWLVLFVVGSVFIILNILYSGNRKTKKAKSRARLLILMGLFISLVVAFAFTNWQVLLKWENASSFNIMDPVFGNDISFYTFILPFYTHLWAFCLTIVILGLFFVFINYITGFIGSIKQKGGFSLYTSNNEENNVSVNWKKLWNKASSHFTILFFIILILAGIGLWLARYELLFSARGAVFGAAYTDVNVTLPLLTVLSVLAFVSAFAFLINKFIGLKKSLIPLGFLIAIAILGSIYGGVVQSLNVEPNEFNLEGPYLRRNINYTLKAYALNKVETRTFSGNGSLTLKDIENTKTIGNVRLWDWRPLERTYEQIQLFRTYYDFNDVDTDRYNKEQYVLSARELEFQDLSQEAKTWVNKHLVYTHGYGMVMSPVSEIREDGLPLLTVKDIPPKSDKFTVDTPQIYYGELTNDFVVVDTTTREFDYPMGDQNKYTNYKGEGGIQLNGLKKLIYSTTQGSIKLLLSSSLKPSSRILLHRNIKQRVAKLAPFLAYDKDPYLVTENGKLYWIIDAYTTTSKYPYSEPIGNTNYVRNSVKVVIDAYNGEVDFYVVDEGPVINTYKKIFPKLFKDYKEMPPKIKKHIRYPEGLFNIQSQIYSLYHMKDAQVFYNKEDAWKIPNELFHGRKRKMEAYYILLDLPGFGAQFSMIMPFTPKGKDNMISWLAGLSDEPNYGKLVLFKFSKQELIYGPIQIENRIDQNTRISRLFSLWDQQGSNVIRGNLLVIPIKNSILYVEPVYLQASSGGIPELKRVIVVYRDNLVMEKNLEKALQSVSKGQITNKTEEGKEELPTLPKNLINRANELYEKAQDALKNGNFKQYADYIEQLGEVLEKLGE